MGMGELVRQEFGFIVTSPITIGFNIVNAAPPQTVSVQPSGERADFANLIALGSGTVTPETRALPGSIIKTDNLPAIPATADTILGEMLASLLEKLEALTSGLKDDQPLDDELLAEIVALIGEVDKQIEVGGALPMPETIAFDRLMALSKDLGLAPQDAEAINPLDVLARLATKVADIAREQAPEISVRLAAFAKLLDGQSAAIETALANAAPDAAMRKHLLGTEAQPSAIKALQQADETHSNAVRTPPNASENAPIATSQPKESQPDSAPRSLTADSDITERPATGAAQNQQPAQALAASAAASTADQGAQTETPDGLTLTPAQSTTAPQAAAAARPAAAAYHRPDPQLNMPHIAAEIARSIQNGINRFDIRLNPAELGRIDVRLEVDQSGNVLARLSVERSETLDLMQRDQRALEKALADAGLDASKTDLEFSLKQQGSNEREGGEKQTWRADSVDAEEIGETQTQTTLYRGYARLDAVNLWV